MPLISMKRLSLSFSITFSLKTILIRVGLG